MPDASRVPAPAQFSPAQKKEMESLSAEEVRNAAICLLAADAALCDDMTPEEAVASIRLQEAALDREPWADGKHSGDCTQECMTCCRCMFEEAEDEARRRYVE